MVSEDTKPRVFNPPTVPTPPPTYSQACVTPILSTSKLVTLAGQTGRRADGTLSASFAEQAAEAYKAVHNALLAAGATPRDIVFVRHYIVTTTGNAELDQIDIVERGWAELWTAYLDKEASGHRPPDTVLGVAALAKKPLWYEVERQRHLKCDGKHPCIRCVDSESSCTFVPSRRGQRTRASRHGQCITAPAIHSPSSIQQAKRDSSFEMSDKSSEYLFRDTTPPTMQYLAEWNKPTSVPVSAEPRSRPIYPSATRERCVSSYYYNFHASHPLVLPQAQLLPLMKEDAVQPLLAVMHWVGSLYIAPETAQKVLMSIAMSAVDQAKSTSANGFTVQAMIVLLVALDGAGHREQAIALLSRVKEIALRLGMNYNSFGKDCTPRSSALNESWRRTWWELYVLDGMFAGAHRATRFTIFDVPTDVGIPCEEDEYENEQIPLPQTVEDLDDRDLNIDDRRFSSFAYRILSAQNLGKVMQKLQAAELDDGLQKQLEILLTSWRQNLPASKRDSLHRDGRPDEMMFQAHMLNHTTSILLHRSRAQLDVFPAKTIDACAASDAPEEDYSAPSHVNPHTSHVLFSANEICNMITHRTPLIWHTHFFICAIVLSSIVQLSSWSAQLGAAEDSVREKVRLCIGALRQISTVWGTAAKAMGQIKEVAGQISLLKKQSRQMEQFLISVADEEMMNIFEAETSAMVELESVSDHLTRRVE
ncbi:hypothetical protein PWT90_07436 [Aphanocladium album]|nr:hypothetical protein PWT90_07436 [Aphanocladium album]